MATLEVNSDDRRRAEGLVDFVANEVRNWPIEARMVFAVEVTRLLKPEIDELRRRAEAQRIAGNA